MTSFKRITTGMAAALLLASVTSGARGQVVGNAGLSLGRESKGLTILKGTVVCTKCAPDEVQKAQPTMHHLYLLIHKQDQVVMQVRAISGSEMWEAPLSPRFQVRAKDSVFQQLTAEENLLKEVEITGIPWNTGTLDIFTVTIVG